jgi:hypothetical protein
MEATVQTNASSAPEMHPTKAWVKAPAEATRKSAATAHVKATAEAAPESSATAHMKATTATTAAAAKESHCVSSERSRGERSGCGEQNSDFRQHERIPRTILASSSNPIAKP